MKIHLTFYGGLKQDIGIRQRTLDVAGDSVTVRELADRLMQEYPILATRLATVAYVVNDELVDPSYILHDGDEAGLLPPVSGG